MAKAALQVPFHGFGEDVNVRDTVFQGFLVVVPYFVTIFRVPLQKLSLLFRRHESRIVEFNARPRSNVILVIGRIESIRVESLLELCSVHVEHLRHVFQASLYVEHYITKLNNSIRKLQKLGSSFEDICQSAITSNQCLIKESAIIPAEVVCVQCTFILKTLDPVKEFAEILKSEDIVSVTLANSHTINNMHIHIRISWMRIECTFKIKSIILGAVILRGNIDFFNRFGFLKVANMPRIDML